MMMKNKLRMVAALVVMLVLASHISLLHAKVEQRPVYICGYAVNFADSTTYLTSIQCIDTAYVESKNGFLMDRNQYSEQLAYYLRKVSGGKHYTCSVLFDTKQQRLQKRVDKVRRRDEKSIDVHLQVIDAQSFQFVGEQYIEPTAVMVGDETPVDGMPNGKGASAKKGKKAHKSAKGGKH